MDVLVIVPEGVCTIVTEAFGNIVPDSVATLPRIDDVVVFANATAEMPTASTAVIAKRINFKELDIVNLSQGKICLVIAGLSARPSNNTVAGAMAAA